MSLLAGQQHKIAQLSAVVHAAQERMQQARESLIQRQSQAASYTLACEMRVALVREYQRYCSSKSHAQHSLQ